MSATFNWEKHEVVDVGHDPQLMANDALQYLLPSLLSNETFELNQQIIVYPNPTSFGNVTIKSSNFSEMNVQVFDILGKQVKKETLTNNTLNVSDLKPGVYHVKIIQNNAVITKKIVIK